MNLNRKQLSLMLTVVMLATVLLTTLTVVALTPTTTFTISGGVYPGGPSYTVYVISGTYTAKDQNGVIEFQETNASNLVQDCLDSLTTGGKLYFLVGRYQFDSQITVTYDSVTIEGEVKGHAFDGVVFEFTGSGAFIMVGSANLNAWYTLIENVRILDNGSGTVGITTYADEPLIRNVEVAYFDVGIYLVHNLDLSGYTTAQAVLSEVNVNNCVYEGIKVGMGDVFASNIITAACATGLSIELGGFSGVNIHSWGNDIGVYLGSSYNINFANLEIEDNADQGLYVHGFSSDVDRVAINGGLLWNNPGATSHIHFVCENTFNITNFQMSNMRFDDSAIPFGMYTPSGNFTQGNIIGSSFESALTSYPTDLKINLCWNVTTWIP